MDSCNTCKYNDDGLCDMYGILIDEDNFCNKWKDKKDDSAEE